MSDERDLVRWYLKRIQLADHLILGPRERACSEPIPEFEAAGFDDVPEARAWVARNRRNLLALIELAAAQDWHFEAWALAEAMWVYYRTSTLHADAERCYRTAVAAAGADGDTEAETTMRLLLTRVRTAARVGDASAPDVTTAGSVGLYSGGRAASRLAAVTSDRSAGTERYAGALATAQADSMDYGRRARLYVAASGGDREAQQALVEELNEVLWRAARRSGLDRESAADAVQTAWLRLWRPETQLEQPRALTKWLLTTVRREAWRKVGGSRREMIADPIDVPGSEPRDRRDQAEREAVRRAFLAQPERCRRLLAYVAAVDEPDYDNVAEALGMKRGSIGPTRGRCLNRLRSALLADPDWAAIGTDPDLRLDEGDPLDAADAGVLRALDELHDRDDPFPEDRSDER